MPTIEARRQTKRGRFYEIPPLPPKSGIELYPSVTTILSCIGKPALVNWAAKVEREMVIEEAYRMAVAMSGEKLMPEASWKAYLNTRLGETKASQKELSKAGEIGTQAHKLIENALNQRMNLPAKDEGDILASEPARLAFKHWKEWASAVDLEPIASEQVIWSHRHRYAGTLDLLARVNGRLAVIDWKTGKYVYNEAHLQNAAYRQAVREMGHGDPELGIIVRLPKTVDDPSFQAVEADKESISMDVFLHVMELWHWQEDKQNAWENIQKKFPETHAGQSLEEGH
jgi:hypothetical protein